MSTNGPRVWAIVLAVLALAALVSPAWPARADVFDEAWQRANQAYREGDLAAAAAAFTELDRHGVVSADLYYNLGIVHFRLGQLGHAAWSFERALTLHPGDEDARFNLDQVRKLLAQRTRDKLENPGDPLWIRAVTLLPAAVQTWLFALFYLATFALLFVRLWRPAGTRAVVTAGAAIAGCFALGFGALLAGRTLLDRIPFAVLLPDTVAVKEGADTRYRTSFELHAGLRVRVVDVDADWVRIRLGNGLEGWVRADDVGRL